MGGPSGSTSRSRSDHQTDFTTSPFGALFMNLFEGSEFDINRGGAIQPSSLADVDPIFGRDTFSSIADLLEPNRPWSQDLGALGGQAQDLFGNIMEGANTGYADRLMDLENNILFSSTIPELKEQFGNQLGLNVGDSDFNTALARAVEGSAYKTAAGAVDNIGKFTQLGMEGIPGMASLEQVLSDAATARTPGGQALDLFNTFASLGTQQSFLGGQSGQTKSTMKQGAAA